MHPVRFFVMNLFFILRPASKIIEVPRKIRGILQQALSGDRKIALRPKWASVREASFCLGEVPDHRFS